ncbi:TetR/AcrR family transcriptional regulator [Streptomyces hoynatensis]|uniref:TetR/AcrR family transcriptional regulator n=1 Tax=Streptomyces hoynatensis TaxID=1141874 RepID=A0A3A9YZ25_9ACTN|nr:TetR/AcrR family transcriptional regulator [Streptomyces hoynatensis]RKN40446.1 TetR/AcrR family transcriptional regulator [Streptomyces hoynatensis]
MNGRPPPPSPPYRRLSVEERRRQIIAAAQGLFARNAPEDVSLEDVAAAAGVSRPLVYRYFPGGKQQLYEAALSAAAERLERCFEIPERGPLSARMAEVLDRYLAFVDQHAEGFTALLKGGSVVETSRTTATVDRVRRVAADHVLRHLRQPSPSPWLLLTVRTWLSVVEAASLIWLDEGRQWPPDRLRDWLLDQLMGDLVVTAGRDRPTARMLRPVNALEPRGGRRDRLIGRTLALFVTWRLRPRA